MGPTKATIEATPRSSDSRPRRGSLPELKSPDKASAEKKVPTGPRANPLYKTRLCMNFQTTGSCPYTEKCQFAHGVKELEKWENWRVSHKSEESKSGHESSSEGSRSRSQSFDKSSRTLSSESHDFGSPQSLNWEVSTPLKETTTSLDEHVPLCALSNFSFWSSMLDDNEYEKPQRAETSRPRAATYDNISQLRDAPTLFPSPPVLSSLNKLNLSH
jgi:hypothetical protein